MAYLYNPLNESYPVASDILEFLSDLESLKESDPEEFEDYEDEYNLVKEFRESFPVSDSIFRALCFIAEREWLSYATERADDIFELNRTGAATWFNYDEYADDLAMDFQLIEYDNETFYYREF